MRGCVKKTYRRMSPSEEIEQLDRDDNKNVKHKLGMDY